MQKMKGAVRLPLALLLGGAWACAISEPRSPVCDGASGARGSCDGGAPSDGPVCEPSCRAELGLYCEGEPARCVPRCGDGVVAGDEPCDEGPANGSNALRRCGSDCRPRPGFECASRGEGVERCQPICGDALVIDGEDCDDGNGTSGDGCSSTCSFEVGFLCQEAPTVCAPICGDGLRVGGETCDDGNQRAGDGCSATCVDRLRWRPLAGQLAPSARWDATAVWTGRDMFLWGGAVLRNFRMTHVSGGGLFDPASRAWRGINTTGAPSARSGAAAVWTGTEVIVWGGIAAQALGDGGRFDPVTNTWRPISRRNAPSPRIGASAVWTGEEMIVFGGYDELDVDLAGGGAYDPITDTWRTLSTQGAPSARRLHTAVWTGEEMVVFGGLRGGLTVPDQDDAAYDPIRNIWRPLSRVDAPPPRSGHIAVWTGVEMIVAGGGSNTFLSDAASYDPKLDAWRPIAPLPTRDGVYEARAFWTGSAVVLYGGWGPAILAAKYIPAIDAWFPLPLDAAPTFGAGAATVLADRELVVFSGLKTTPQNVQTVVEEAGLFDLESETWSPIEVGLDLEPRTRHSSVVIDSELIVFGGHNGLAIRSGARLDVRTGERRALPLEGAPSERFAHTAVATSREMWVFGGRANNWNLADVLGDGASYDLALDRWTAMPLAGAPSPRAEHVSILTNTEMIVWGGTNGSSALGDGARFDLTSRTWRPMPSSRDGLAPRSGHSAVWTGTEMIVWGGWSGQTPLATGARFDPGRDLWTPISRDGAPSPRASHTAIWTGTEMIVWGGADGAFALGTGARYDPVHDRWTPLPVEGAPAPRASHSATWTGAQMVVFGGETTPGVSSSALGNGARYDPTLDVWLPLPSTGGPAPRVFHSAAWMGQSMMFWGGGAEVALDDGALLDL